MQLRNVLLAATILAVPVAVKAQPVTGLYVGAGAGFNYLTETNVKSVTLGPRVVSTSGKLNDNGGFVGLMSVGYGLGNGLRLEIEGNYRQNTGRIKNAPGVFGGGQIQQYGAMFNALFDIDTGAGIYPYVGVGAGYGEVATQGFRVGSTTGSPVVNLRNTAKGGLAVQGILGAGIPISAMPGLSITAEVRGYANVDSHTYSGSAAGIPGSAKLDSLINISGLIGVRYAFNAAPPPPPPGPGIQTPMAPDATRTYLVFFDWDRADLTARAKQIIAEAAQASTRVKYTRIDVAGHTDTTGSAAYNQTLSVRRAQAVAAELVKDGVPRNAIDIHGYGFSRPLVATGPGVREPQNRRVEIVLK